MRKALYAVGALLAAGLLSLAALYLFIDPNRFRDQIAAELQTQLHRPVTLGRMSLQLIPLAIGVENVVIGEKATFPTKRPFAKAAAINVRASVFALLRGNIAVNSLTLTSPEVELVRNAAGQWNFADLTEPAPGSSAQPLTLDILSIIDGSIGVTHLANPTTRAVYPHIDAQITGIGPKRDLAIQASVRLTEGKGGTLSFEGKGLQPFEGTLSAKNASLSGLTAFAGARSLLDGELTGSVAIHALPARTTFKGHVDLANATRDNKALGIPMAVDFDVIDDGATGKIQATQLALTAGKMTARGSGAYDMRTTAVDARFAIPGANLAEVLALAQVFGGPDATGTGLMSLDLTIHGPGAAPDLAGNLTLRDATLKLASLTKPVTIASTALKFDGRSATISALDLAIAGTKIKGNGSVSNFPAPSLRFDLDADHIDVAEWQSLTAAASPSKPAKSSAASPITALGSLHIGTLTSQGLVLTNVRTEAAYQMDQLTLSPLTAQLFGGTHTGKLVADLRPATPSVSLDLKLADVETNQLLSATSSIKNTLYGALAASGGLRMNLGAADMPRTLNGNLNTSIVNGRLAGTDILKELAGVGKFLGYQPNPQSITKIMQLGGDIAIKDGLASTNNLQMIMEGGSLGAAGTVNLVDQTINLKATAILDKAFSQKVGGTGIGGYLSTALSNNKGELVMPVNITGTFDKPRFAPDPVRMAEMKLKSILPGGVTSRGLGGILAPGASNPDGSKPPSPAQSIINIFRKKK